MKVLDNFRRMLTGRLLTVVEAAIADLNQREALKSLVRQAIQQSIAELENDLRGETTT